MHQGSGGTCFITVQQIIENVNIYKASLLLSANVNVDSFNIEKGHSCFNCSFLLDENSAGIFDGLPELESSVPEDTKMVLAYMAGYIYIYIYIFFFYITTSNCINTYIDIK